MIHEALLQRIFLRKSADSAGEIFLDPAESRIVLQNIYRNSNVENCNLIHEALLQRIFLRKSADSAGEIFLDPAESAEYRRIFIVIRMSRIVI